MEFRSRASHFIAVFIVTHRVDVTPTVAIVPWVINTCRVVRITLDTLGIDGTTLKCHPLVDLSCQIYRCIVTGEVIFLGSLVHTVLIQIAQTDIECSFTALSRNRKVVSLRNCHILNHKVIRIIVTDTYLTSVGIVVPVTAINGRVVTLYRTAVQLFPLFGTFDTFAGDVEECTGYCATETFSSIHDVFLTCDSTHVTTLGNSLERHVGRIVYTDLVSLRTFFAGNKDYAECTLGTIDRR